MKNWYIGLIQKHWKKPRSLQDVMHFPEFSLHSPRQELQGLSMSQQLDMIYVFISYMHIQLLLTIISFHVFISYIHIQLSLKIISFHVFISYIHIQLLLKIILFHVFISYIHIQLLLTIISFHVFISYIHIQLLLTHTQTSVGH